MAGNGELNTHLSHPAKQIKLFDISTNSNIHVFTIYTHTQYIHVYVHVHVLCWKLLSNRSVCMCLVHS